MNPRSVIIDCDPGTDDAVALWLALASPGLDVRMVTVVGGNAGLAATLPNARAIVGLTGRVVPVVAGADRPLLGAFTPEPRVHGADGIGGVVLPEGPPAAPGIVADAIRAVLRDAGPHSVTLVGIGPATNIALALATEPALASHVAEIVLMSGAWGEGNVTPSAEFNAWSDPEALAVVLACGRPITMATLELTAQAFCTPAWLAELAASGGGACARAAHAVMSAVPRSRRFAEDGHPEHDACAVMWLVAPELFTHRMCHVAVELAGVSRGRTVVDRWGRGGGTPNVRLLETMERAGFFMKLKQALVSNAGSHG